MSDIEKIDIGITGMTCASCSTRIEKSLNKLKGVKSAIVNLASEKATLEFNENLIDHDTIKNEIVSGCYGDEGVKSLVCVSEVI